MSVTLSCWAVLPLATRRRYKTTPTAAKSAAATDGGVALVLLAGQGEFRRRLLRAQLRDLGLAPLDLITALEQLDTTGALGVEDPAVDLLKHLQRRDRARIVAGALLARRELRPGLTLQFEVPRLLHDLQRLARLDDRLARRAMRTLDLGHRQVHLRGSRLLAHFEGHLERLIQFVVGETVVSLLAVNQRQVPQRRRDAGAVADLSAQRERLGVVSHRPLEVALVVVDVADVAERARDAIVASQFAAEGKRSVEIGQRPIQIADPVIHDRDVIEGEGDGGLVAALLAKRERLDVIREPGLVVRKRGRIDEPEVVERGRDLEVAAKIAVGLQRFGEVVDGGHGVAAALGDHSQIVDGAGPAGRVARLFRPRPPLLGEPDRVVILTHRHVGPRHLVERPDLVLGIGKLREQRQRLLPVGNGIARLVLAQGVGERREGSGPVQPSLASQALKQVS